MRTSFIVGILLVAACGSVNDPGTGNPDAAGDPPDAREPDGVPADAVVCTPNAFIACDDAETARSCNATGDGFVIDACGAPGCNATAMRCNECVPDAIACDGAVVERCDADGLALPDETCALSCVDAPAAHCAYLSPKYLPDVCDALATDPTFMIGAGTTFDTGLDSACTGGVVLQSAGPPVCVVRATDITIASGMTVTGFRALALVADDALDVTGTIDAAGVDTTGGPGATRVSGARSNQDLGGGGSGFSQAGNAGGSVSTDGGGGTGGGAFDPLAVASLLGGARPAGPSFGVGVNGGGGGGAVTLISCRGTVSVSGVIDVGGGGGGPGYDTVLGPQLVVHGGGGGGSGGYVAIQGVGVTITGRLFSNGGGGGGGGGSDSVGNKGIDGTRSSSAQASGGNGAVGGGNGGAGGIGASGPGVGRHPPGTGSPGGGGGSTGAFQIYTPAGVTPTVAPIDISPQFSPTLTAPTR